MPSLPATPPERRVPGRSIGLPLVETLGAIHSHAAARIAWHSHRMFELLFLLEGATAYEFADGETVDLPGGHFLIMAPGDVHRGLHEVRMPAKLCGIVFNPRRTQAAQHTPFTSRELEWIARQCERHSRVPRVMSPELRRLATALDRAVQGLHEHRTEPSSRAGLRLLACAVILEAARQLTAVRRTAQKRAVASAIAHMAAHFHEPLPMPNLATAAGCGRARLFLLFKQSTGMTPNDYLQRLRVKKAGELLTRTGRTITEIAQATGYSSSQYFCNVFRKYTGTTPLAFRERGRKR